MQKLAIKQVLVLMTIFLTSCATTTYKYTPPTTEAGLFCITQCQNVRNACRNNEANKAESKREECKEESKEEYAQCRNDANIEYQECKHTADADYVACLKYSKDRNSCQRVECSIPSCYKSSCYENPDYRYCESDYRECYQQCGGDVQIEEK